MATKKKILHIIAHSHWDREWYMSFEAHRIRLVELIDALIEVMERNPAYTYYHLDGQFIVIEDYLEIRPQMRARLLALIEAGRLQIGPWYVLQDEFLTSGEANIRNMLYGLRLCRGLSRGEDHAAGAEPVLCGYFPDAFGNIAQAPQILQGFGIDNAVFGRGLNEMGSDNEIVRQNGILKSELIWRAPDGSEVIGVMFANWYHNAMELPAEGEALKARIEGIAAAASRFAVTDHLLGMNGCDHQPLQRNLHEVIALANEAQETVEVRQSNFNAYIAEIRKSREKLTVYEGEIAGQLTSGYHLLVNTASARIDVKQCNQAAQNLLERISEPLSALAMLGGGRYDDDLYLYAWRRLMQNHPHDSICSCSCDAVYEEMRVRFQKSMQTAQTLAERALAFIAANTDTSDGTDRNIVVVSLEPSDAIVTVTANVDYPLDDTVSQIHIEDENGCVTPAEIIHCGRTFTYTLPDDRFRQPAYVNRFTVTMPVRLENGIGVKVLRVVRSLAVMETKISVTDTGMENAYIALHFNANGSFTMTDKRTGRSYDQLNLFEDVRDNGDTYQFEPAEGDVPVTSRCDQADIQLYAVTPYAATIRVENFIDIDADIVSFITLTDGIARVDIKTCIVNRAENHRIRALFRTDIETDTVLAEGQFDLTRRFIEPWAQWRCPSNPQRCQTFAALETDGGGDAILVAHKGLHEYEVLRDGGHTLAITLLRCVGEMGDWGEFPTPKAQCKGEYTLAYAVVPYHTEGRAEAYALGYSFASQAAAAIAVGRHGGGIRPDEAFVHIDNPFLRMSALKKAEDRDTLILRLYNLSEDTQTVHIRLNSRFRRVYQTNLQEERIGELPLSEGTLALSVTKKKIITLELEV